MSGFVRFSSATDAAVLAEYSRTYRALVEAAASRVRRTRLSTSMMARVRDVALNILLDDAAQLRALTDDVFATRDRVSCPQQPARMNGQVHEDEVAPTSLQSLDGAASAVNGAVVDDPENTARGAVRRSPHDLSNQKLEACDREAIDNGAELRSAVHIPGGEVKHKFRGACTRTRFESSVPAREA